MTTLGTFAQALTTEEAVKAACGWMWPTVAETSTRPCRPPVLCSTLFCFVSARIGSSPSAPPPPSRPRTRDGLGHRQRRLLRFQNEIHHRFGVGHTDDSDRRPGGNGHLYCLCPRSSGPISHGHVYVTAVGFTA